MDRWALKDLQMAGVNWELTEIPMALYAKALQEVKEEKKEEKKEVPVLQRVATSVVPPIEPVVPMSLDIAKAMALRPLDLEALSRMISEFNHPLRSGATNIVLPHIAKSEILLITDIPSSEDDATGRILSGASGELLDKMLAAIGLSRDVVSILPLIFWRTPGGRSPTRSELDLSRPFVDRFIELSKPKLIITMGTLAAAEIGNLHLPKDHGKFTEIKSGVNLVPIYHPNYLLLKPTAKREVWVILQEIQKLLKNA